MKMIYPSHGKPCQTRVAFQVFRARPTCPLPPAFASRPGPHPTDGACAHTRMHTAVGRGGGTSRRSPPHPVSLGTTLADLAAPPRRWSGHVIISLPDADTRGQRAAGAAPAELCAQPGSWAQSGEAAPGPTRVVPKASPSLPLPVLLPGPSLLPPPNSVKRFRLPH